MGSQKNISFFQTMVTVEIYRSTPKIDESTSTEQQKKKPIHAQLESST